jgi:hypothetical protein
VKREHFGLDLRFPFVARRFQIVLSLHVDPIVRRGIEVASETQGGFPAPAGAAFGVEDRFATR